MATNSAINTTNPISVNSGGTGQATLTNHGVLVGATTAAVTQLTVGTNGQVLVGSTAADPAFATISSSDSSITVTAGAGTLGLATTSATTSQRGGVTLASNAEAIAGTDTAKAVTSDDLKAKLGTQTNHGLLVGAGTTAAVTALAVGGTGTLLVGAAAADPAFGTSATGDFTFTSATAAQDRALTVSNTDATAANYSAAHVTVTTQSGSTGDPYVYLNINGGTSYSIGSDNSDSDSLKITTGANPSSATTLFKMLSTGERTMPLQSSFLAKLSAQTAAVTGDGTLYQVICDTEEYDQNSDYNNATGVFTAPTTGKYLFSSGLSFFSVTAGGTSFISILLTTAAQYYVCNLPTKNRVTNFSAVSSDISVCGSIVASMTAGDTCVFQVYSEGGAKNDKVSGAGSISNVTYFGGTLIC